MKLTFKNLKTVYINAKEWFDKVNGNSYFSGTVTLNYGMENQETIKMPFQYGYGNQYEHEAFRLIRERFPRSKWAMENRQTLRERGIIIRSSIQEGCRKRDLMD